MLLRQTFHSLCCCITVFLQLVSSNPRCGSLLAYTWVLAAIPPYLPHRFVSLLRDFLQSFHKQQHKYFFLYSSKTSSLYCKFFFRSDSLQDWTIMFSITFSFICFIAFMGLVNQTNVSCSFKGNTEFQMVKRKSLMLMLGELCAVNIHEAPEHF